MLQPVVETTTTGEIRGRRALVGSMVFTIIGVMVVLVALFLPVETRFGFEVVADAEGVTDGEPSTVTCQVVGGQYEHEGAIFGQAKDEACGRASARRWVLAAAGAAAFGVAGLSLGLRSRRGLRAGRPSSVRSLVTGVAALLALSAIPLGGLGWLGTRWSPSQRDLPAALAQPFEENGLEIILAFETMDSPSVSIESAPPNTTRYVLVTDATSSDVAALIENVADAVRASGFDLRPGTEVTRDPWFAYWGPNVNVGSLAAFVNDEDIGRNWDHDTVSDLRRRAASRSDRPAALVVTFTL